MHLSYSWHLSYTPSRTILFGLSPPSYLEIFLTEFRYHATEQIHLCSVNESGDDSSSYYTAVPPKWFWGEVSRISSIRNDRHAQDLVLLLEQCFPY